MNKGTNFLKEIIKNMETKIESGKEEDSNSRVADSLAEIGATREGKIAISKREKNIYNRIFKLAPNISMDHVYKLFGFIGINEHAIENANYEESFFKTYFYGRVIQKVQVFNNAIMVELSSPSPADNQVPIEYIIEKYKAKGNVKFYEIALAIEELLGALGQLQGDNQSEQQKNDSIKKNLDSLGDQMFVCTLGMRKVAISKTLLTYLEYDIDEFSIQAVKYRAIFTEFFSANSYSTGVKHIIKILKLITELNQKKINMQQFKDQSSFSMNDFIYSKSNVKSFCNMTFYLPTPTFFCHKINFIYYRSDSEDWRPEVDVGRQLAIEGEKDSVKQKEYRLIKQIKDIPSSLLRQNQKRIAGYKVISEDDTEHDRIEEEQ